MFINNGRSGFIAGAAVRPGNYYNANNMNNTNNMGYFSPATYNPVLGKEISDMILLSDLFEEINWEKLFNLYNSVC